MWIFIVIILALICSVSLFQLFSVKRQMREIGQELCNTREENYNKQLTISLVDRDITEMAGQMNRNLDYQKQLKLQAQQSEMQLRQSISDIAHDLRTPITVIKGNLQMLSKEEYLTDKDKEYIQICCEKTDALKEMVDDFFELSYLESEEMEPQLQRIDLTEYLAYFILSHEAVILEKNLEPKITLPEKSLFVKADTQMLNRLLENLFNNVLKHAIGEFILELSQEADKDKKSKIRITFGNKISSEEGLEVEHLFDRTYRGNKARTGGGPGGLGLYIVKLLAKKQNAEAGASVEGQVLKVYVQFGAEE